MPENQLIDDLDLDGDEPLEEDFVLQTKEEKADQAAPETETETPTEPAEVAEEATTTDPETRTVELEFEVESLKEQVAKFEEVQKFLADAASDPQGVLGALAKHQGVSLGSTGDPQQTTGFKWPEPNPEDGLRFPTDDAMVKSVEGYVSETVAPLKAEVARLTKELEGVKPQLSKAQEAAESESKVSATVARVLGVQKLIDLESHARNYGWKPSKEQLTAFVKKNPDILENATDAKSVAKAVVEKLRLAHFDDIMNARSAGTGKPDGSNRAVVGRNDGRGATSEYDSRRQRAGRIVHSGD